jgi:hypothetical protein
MTNICPICNGEIQEGASACPQCGFKLLGSTQSFQPVKLDASEQKPVQNESKSHVLKVVRGPQTGAEMTLSAGTVTLGRDPQCDILLNDMTVSRMHATLEISAKGCVIRDENSFNGVWVNDRMVDACLLRSGDVIQLGAFCLVYK